MNIKNCFGCFKKSTTEYTKTKTIASLNHENDKEDIEMQVGKNSEGDNTNTITSAVNQSHTEEMSNNSNHSEKTEVTPFVISASPPISEKIDSPKGKQVLKRDISNLQDIYKSLNYYNCSKVIRKYGTIEENKLSQPTSDLEDHLHDLLPFIENNLKTSFNNIFEKDNIKIFLQNWNLVNAIVNTKDGTNINILEKYPDRNIEKTLITYWATLRRDINDKFKKYKNQNDFVSIANLLRILSELKYLDINMNEKEDNTLDINFYEIYDECSEIYYKQLKNKQDIIEQYLLKKDGKKLAKELEKLIKEYENKNDINSKKDLEEKVSEFIIEILEKIQFEIKGLNNQADFNVFQKFKADFNFIKHLEKIKKTLSNSKNILITEKRLYKDIECYLTKIYDNIQDYIHYENLNKAEEEREELEKILIFLKQYNLNYKIDLKKYENTNKHLESFIDNNINKYIKEKTFSGKRFFEETNRLAKKNKKYKKYTNNIQDSYKEANIIKIDKIINNKELLVEDKDQELRNLLNEVKISSPNEIIEEVTSDIIKSLDNLSKDQKKQKERLEKKLNKDTSIKTLYKEITNNNSRETQKLVIKNAIKKITNIKIKIEQEIETSNTLDKCKSDILEFAITIKLFSHHISQQEEVCDLNFLESIFEEKWSLFKTVNSFISSINKGLYTVNDDIAKQEILKNIPIIELAFSIYNLSEQLSKVKYYENNDISKEITSFFPKNMENLITQFIEAISEIYNNNLNRFTKNLKKYEVKGIINSLKNEENTEPLFLVLQEINKTCKLLTLNNLCNQFSKNKFFAERKKYIQNYLIHIQKQITIYPIDLDGINEYNLHCDNMKQQLDFIREMSEEKQIDSSIYDGCIKNIKKEIEQITIENEYLLQNLEEENFKKYNQNINKLKAIQRLKINELTNISTKNVNKTDKNILNNVDKLKKEAINDKDKICENIIQIKKISNKMPYLKNKVDKKIDNILETYKKANKNDDNALYKLMKKLEANKNDRHEVGSVLLDHKIFDDYKSPIWPDASKKHGIEYVLKNLEGTNINDNEKLKLNKVFQKYHDEYEEISNNFLIDKTSIQEIVKTVKPMFYNSNNKVDNNFKSNLPKLLANIFATWTFLGAKYPLNTNFLKRPHPAQVVSILQMLEATSDQALKNNLIQIPTGEGKSITLAVTAIILALLDYEVNIVCYSSHLNERDNKSFEELFKLFNVAKLIKYNIFTELCEIEINSQCDIRKRVIDFLNGKQFFKKNDNKTQKKIILIDEVDVFFNLYGKIYSPIASLTSNDIRSIIDYIWKERDNNLTLSKLKKNNSYSKIIKKYNNYSQLMNNIFSVMIKASRNYADHKYFFSEKTNRIGYKEHDAIVYDSITYGDHTTFAYYKEYEKDTSNKQLEKILNEHKTLNINCGGFLYSEIPKNFDYIMGVTGTLKTLTKPEQDTIEKEYDIQNFSYMPSVFGQNNLEFQENARYIKLCNRDDYFNDILNEILQRQSSNQNIQRPVIVFFESKTKLDKFYNYPAVFSQRGKLGIQILHEGLSPLERITRIRQATYEGQITLATPSFARGIDFIILNETINNNGGLHVLSTYFPELKSEEVQMKGRTARQGKKGSFSMIIFQDELEKFGFNFSQIRDLRNVNNIYKEIDIKRNQFFVKNYEQKLTQTEVTEEEHKESNKFFKNLQTISDSSTKKIFREFKKKDIYKFLLQQNIGCPDTISQRTAIVVDATGSMSPFLEKTKEVISLVFQEASEMLKGTPFEMQFIFYRNYSNDEDNILEASPWSGDHKILKQFLNKISTSGGLGNEAIEIGLHYAAQQNELSQVILIGDYPPNTEDEIKSHRNRYYEKNYWENSKYGKVQHYLKELKYFKNNKIKIHSFYLRNEAETKKSFNQIAKVTGGYCKFLDIELPNKASNSIVPLITSELIRVAKGDKAVDEYIFKKGYKS